MNSKLLHKLFDLAVFSILCYFAIHFYQTYAATQDNIAAYKFDLVYVATALFVMARRPDINTLSLGVILLSLRAFSRLLLFDLSGLSGFIVYPAFLLFDLLAICLIWFRPVLFYKYIGPFKGKPGYALTNQDDAMWLLYGLNAVFMLLMTIEHASRKINDWFYENSRILYNSYETIQFVFMVAGLVVLYYMTHDNSKKKREDRNKGSQ